MHHCKKESQIFSLSICMCKWKLTKGRIIFICSLPSNSTILFRVPEKPLLAYKPQLVVEKLRDKPCAPLSELESFKDANSFFMNFRRL